MCHCQLLAVKFGYLVSRWCRIQTKHWYSARSYLLCHLKWLMFGK